MDTVKRKINIKRIGVICTVVSWCLLFSAGILFINYEKASTSILYYFIYAIASLLTITGCVLFSTLIDIDIHGEYNISKIR